MADLVFPGATAGKLNSTSMPNNQDLVIYKGDYVELLVVVKDALGAPLNLSGSTGKAQMKLDYQDTSPINFAVTTTGTAGEMRIFLSSTQSSALVPGSYVWDFQVTNSGGNTKTYLAGDVTVYPEVTT